MPLKRTRIAYTQRTILAIAAQGIAGALKEPYLALKSRGVSYRPRKTSQAMIVEAIKAYLAEAEK